LLAPRDDIPAPPFPGELTWVNVAMLRMDQQIGRPVLVEFWDFCRPNSIRTLPYVRAWHERYAEDGLRVVGIHRAGFPPSEDPAEVAAACERLGVRHPVVVDERGELWDFYGTLGWPARFLWNQQGTLHSFHYGEGAYDETEREIQALLGVDRELVAPVRPEDEPGALLEPQTEDQPGLYSGPYEAGGVWAVVSGAGELRAYDAPIAVEHAGAVAVIEHERHTEGVLELEASAGVEVHATCFTPGLAR
jgi:hypothetical protein